MTEPRAPDTTGQEHQPPLYVCPVCEYDQLLRPPEDYIICPQCGTEFGYDDFATSHDDLRQQWIAGGRRFWSQSHE